MREKVMVCVRLPATQRTYEFCVAYDLDVEGSANLMARLLAAREETRFVAGGPARLMHLDGELAGTLLEGTRSIRELVIDGVLTNGSSLALV